ncbi:MAG: helix-turn-helix domain-containing protein [Firmicutes bacterium]|nr:helix-turn-helix domain-containing protein [Bacillota bacterium]
MENEEYYKNIFVERLKKLIGEKSVKVFATEIGVSENTVKGWLKKKIMPKSKHLIILASKFGVRMNYLVGLE